MTTEQTLAQKELRIRQGIGARYDAVTAPQKWLLWARRGTAYLARKLNEMSDAELSMMGQNDWSRREVISSIAYQARALARLVEAARTGRCITSADTMELHLAEIDDGRTLPAHALRYLFEHSAVHLNVEWRDLHDEGWSMTISDPLAGSVTLRETVLLRAQAVWTAAILLKNGARRSDIPPELDDIWELKANWHNSPVYPF